MMANSSITIGESEAPPSTAARQYAYWDPQGTTFLQCGNQLFRIPDPDAIFVGLGSPADATLGVGNARLVTLHSISQEDFQLLLSRNRAPFNTLLDTITRIYESPETPESIALRKLSAYTLLQIFPSRTFAPDDDAEAALLLAIKWDLDIELKKRLWYHVVTTRELHASDDPTTSSTLLPALQKRCTNLLDTLISHFTALLFTPPPTSHMECTDVIAESWMNVVIQPALESDGVYKPLESLNMMKAVDWKSFGVCDRCVKDKEVEWDKEADIVWHKMADWIDER